MNKGLIEEAIDDVYREASYLQSHSEFLEKENISLKQEKAELIKYLEEQIENEKKVQKFLYENENTKLVEKAKVNSAIGTYQEILDKIRGE